MQVEEFESGIAEKVINKLLPLLVDRKDDEIIFDVKQLAEYLFVDTTWIYAHTCEIPHFKLRKYIRFRKTSIDDWIDEKENTKTTQNNKDKEETFSTGRQLEGSILSS